MLNRDLRNPFWKACGFWKGVLQPRLVGSREAPSKVFLLFFLFSDWLKSNHLRSRIGRGFLDIFRAIFVAL